MSFRFLSLLSVALSLCSCVRATTATPSRILRICSDPNNLPFSNQRLEGFENKIADLIANDLNATVQYTWWAQRRGFFRNTLKARECDVVMGVPEHFDMTIATKPYYRSTYVFVSRKSSGLQVSSFDDPLLRRIKIGVQLVGDDSNNTPPAHALSARNIVRNVQGYTLYGDYSQDSPPARIIDAVAKGDVDVAIAWGPLAGYFAKREPVGLQITPVAPQVGSSNLRFVFDISIGVRREDRALRDELDVVLDRRRSQIQEILDQYGIPRV